MLPVLCHNGVSYTEEGQRLQLIIIYMTLKVNYCIFVLVQQMNEKLQTETGGDPVDVLAWDEISQNHERGIK